MPVDPATTEEICRRLVEGESLRSICRTNGMPDKATIFRWLAADEAFRGAYAAARLVQADVYADDLIEISDDATNDWMERKRQDGTTETVFNHEHVQRSKLRVDSRKWVASKLNPRKYGEATLLKHADAEGRKIDSADADIAMRAVSLLSAIVGRVK